MRLNDNLLTDYLVTVCINGQTGLVNATYLCQYQQKLGLAIEIGDNIVTLKHSDAGVYVLINTQCQPILGKQKLGEYELMQNIFGGLELVPASAIMQMHMAGFKEVPLAEHKQVLERINRRLKILNMRPAMQGEGLSSPSGGLVKLQCEDPVLAQFISTLQLISQPVCFVGQENIDNISVGAGNGYYDQVITELKAKCYDNYLINGYISELIARYKPNKQNGEGLGRQYGSADSSNLEH